MKRICLLIGITIAICTVAAAQNKTVTLDYFFNREYKKNTNGVMERFHYMWEDTTYSGFSKLGKVFIHNGFTLKSLETAPDADNLKGSSVYIIVDPDTEKETVSPNYIQPEHVTAIAGWVKAGGVLLVFANDSGNVEFDHLNHLTETFGIHLNGDCKSKVTDDKFDMAAFYIPPHDKVFITAHKVYLKEVSSLRLSGKAKPILSNPTENYIVAATAKYGKGRVVVIGDPWFYNEYLNGRLPAGFDNDKAADDLVKWLGRKL